MPRRGTSQGRIRTVVPWLVAALALPLLAHRALEGAVADRLVPALEDATGEPVTIEGVEVSLLGAVRLRGLSLGDLIHIRSVEARVGLSSLASGQVRADEIVIDSPSANIRGEGNRLRRLARRFSSRRAKAAPTSTAPEQRWRRWPRVRLSGGSLRLDVGARGAAQVDELQVRATERGLRVIVGSVAYRGRWASRVIAADLGRSALDIDLSTAAVTRAVAGDGHLDIDDGALTGSELELSYGLEGEGVIRARARVGGGRLSARHHQSRTELELGGVAARTLSGLLPSADLDSGRVSGEVALEKADARLTVSGRLELVGVRGTIGWLDPNPLDLSTRIAGSASIVAGDDGSPGRSIDITGVELSRDNFVARLTGAVSMDRSFADAAGVLSLAIPETPCAALLSSLPRGLVGPLRGMRLAGNIDVRADLRIAQVGARPVELDVDLDPSRCRVGADAPTANAAGLRGAYEHTLPNGRTVVLRPGAKGYTSLRALPAYVTAAFISAEDGRFYQHHGFDTRQIESSIAKDLEVGRFARGGSTISQQLAKNLFLGRERTLGRKLQEAVLAWRLESVLGKRQILERYLNIIQLGIATYGIDAASREWFGKPAQRLSPREAAFLASLTRAPSSTTRAIRASGGITPIMVKRVEHILKSMSYVGAIDARTLARERARQLVLVPTLASR